MIKSERIRPVDIPNSVPCQHASCHKFAVQCREVSFRRGGIAFYYECSQHTVPPTSFGMLDTRWPL